MSGKGSVCGLAFVLAVLAGGSALAVDCTVCDECAADPAFVQRDFRNPGIVFILRRLASRELREEGLTAVVVLSHQEDAGSVPRGEARRTVVLVGAKGSAESIEVKGDLPAEVKAYVLDE